MKIYYEDILIDDIPHKGRKAGDFFPRLVGVRISNVQARNAERFGIGNLVHVEPIYLPLVSIDVRPGATYIWVNGASRPLALITLTRRFPFINVFRFDWSKIEESE